MDNISALCSYTQKIRERWRLCAGCDKKETGCIRASAAQTHSTFSKSVMVAMGVSKLGRMDMSAAVFKYSLYKIRETILHKIPNY